MGTQDMLAGDAPLGPPGQRRKKNWNKEESRWRCYPAGLVSFSRGMEQALAQGQKKIPEFEELQQVCRQAKAELRNLNQLSDQELEQIAKQLLTVGQALANAQKVEVQEVSVYEIRSEEVEEVRNHV